MWGRDRPKRGLDLAVEEGVERCEAPVRRRAVGDLELVELVLLIGRLRQPAVVPSLRIPAKAATRSDQRRPPVGAKRREAAHVSRSGRLGVSFLVFSPVYPSSSRLWELWESWAGVGGRPGSPSGVGRSGGGWAAARSFPYPGSFHSRGGRLLGGRGPPAPRRAAIAS